MFFFALVVVLAVAVCLVVLLGDNQSKTVLPKSSEPESTSKVKPNDGVRTEESYTNITQMADLTAVLEHPEFKMVMIGASWCAPCKVFKNRLKESKFDSFPVIYVDGETDQFSSYAEQYVTAGYPQSLFYEGGELLPVDINTAPAFGYSIPGVFSVEELNFIRGQLEVGIVPDINEFRREQKGGVPDQKLHEEVWLVDPQQGWITALEFDEDNGILFASTREGKVLSLDPVTGTVLNALAVEKTILNDIKLSKVKGKSVIATISNSGLITLISYVVDEKNIPSFVDTREVSLPGRFAGAYLSFNNEGDRLAATSQASDVLIIDPDSGETISVLEGAMNGNRGVEFSPDGRLLAFGGKDSGVYVYETNSWKLVHKLIGHENWVRTVAFDSTGNYIFSAGRDYSSRIWDLRNLESSTILPVESRRCFKSFASNFENPRLIISGSYDGNVRLFDRATLQLLRTIEYDAANRQGVSDLIYLSDLDLLVTGHVNGEIRGTHIGNIEFPAVKISELTSEKVTERNTKVTVRERKKLTLSVYKKESDQKEENSILALGAANMEFVAIPSGEIQVEEVRRSISAAISGMQIAKTELTVQQAIDLGVPAARFYFADPNVAAHNLSADDIRTIIKNFREITGRSIRLPTELEWEYAARAGSSEVYPEGQLEKQAYINANSNLRPQPVAQLIPNKWGLYDMLGNVREVVLFGDDNETSPGMYIVKGAGFVNSAHNAGFESSRYYSLSRGKKQPYDINMWIGVRFLLEDVRTPVQ